MLIKDIVIVILIGLGVIFTLNAYNVYTNPSLLQSERNNTFEVQISLVVAFVLWSIAFILY